MASGGLLLRISNSFCHWLPPLYITADLKPHRFARTAGMNGLEPCSAVLSDATARQLQGSASSEALCVWRDDSTLIVQLTMLTHAAVSLARPNSTPADSCPDFYRTRSRPLHFRLHISTAGTPARAWQGGMTITTRRHVLWPKTWDYPGTCEPLGGSSDDERPTSLCAEELSLNIDTAFPCDRQQTLSMREPCVEPSAVIQAPEELSSCPGAALTLDASRSTGGGIKPLVFLWGSNPRATDNYQRVQAAFKSQVRLRMMHVFAIHLHDTLDLLLYLPARCPSLATSRRRHLTVNLA